MTVEQPNIIDVYAHDPDIGSVVLSITDHLNWENNQHLIVRQEKINKYLEFIESGEIWDSLKLPKDSTVKIELVCLHRPNDVGTEFIVRVTELLEGAGYEFVCNVAQDFVSDKTKKLQSS